MEHTNDRTDKFNKFRNFRTIRCEETKGGGLRYCLTSSDAESDGQVFTTYGITIDCSLFGEQDHAGIPDITTDFSAAQQLFDLVHLYMVTPMQLAEVTEDFLNDPSRSF